MIDSTVRSVARPSIPKLLLALTFFLVFLALGVWMAGVVGPPMRAGAEWKGWLIVIVFAPLSALGFKRLKDRADQIIVDRNGLFYKQWSKDVIPWTEIAGLHENKIGRHRVLCVTLKEPQRYPPPTWIKWLNFGMTRRRFGDIAVSTSGTNMSFAKLRDAAEAHWTRHLLNDGQGPR